MKRPLTNSPKKILIVAAAVFVVTLGGVAAWRLSADKQTTNTGAPTQQQTEQKPSDTTTLTIADWSARLEVAAPNAYFEPSTNDNIYLSTEKLEELRDRIGECKSGLRGIFVDRNLAEVSVIEPACMPEESDASKEIKNIQQALRDSLKSPQKL